MSEKICPDCRQRRPHHEIFCQTIRADGAPCGWNLTDVLIDVPQPASSHPGHEVGSVCVNGHTLNPGDLICGTCGADTGGSAAASASGGMGEEPREPYEVQEISNIAGWEILARLACSGASDRFHVRGAEEALGILTLYPVGLLHDRSVDAAVDALAPTISARVLARGEHEGRRLEVVESSDGRTFEDIEVSAEDSAAFRQTVRALGSAIHTFSRAGLRHRDLRPHAILPGLQPASLTVSSFGFARLSSHDLDTAVPVVLSRYAAPEMLAGAVTPSSDWWSLGIILLEKLTRGACFEGISDQAFLMSVVANGADIPSDLSDETRLLLRGLLARDRTARWNWEDVEAWSRGEPRPAPDEGKPGDDVEAGSIELGGRTYRTPSKYALAAGRNENWAEARDQLTRGVVAVWLEEFPTAERMRSALRNVMRREGLDDDSRLSVGLKALNPDMPLVRAGEIVTPSWLLQHPVEGYELISGPVPALLDQLGVESWLMQLQKRDADVRRRAAAFDIELSEDILRINLLCTSRRRLDELWEEQRRGAPDSDHRGVASLMDRPQLAEEDVLILVSAGKGQFRPLQEVLREAAELARKEGVTFDEAASAAMLRRTRRDVMQRVAERVENFARCGRQRIDEWVDQFRLERRTSLSRAAVILSVPAETWKRPPGQEYVSQLLGFFEKRINVSVSRGALARMTITRTSPRLDLTELGAQPESANHLLNHLLERSDVPLRLDPAIFASNPDLEHRLRTLVSRAELLRRETGIDGLYMGFPFILAQQRDENVKARIAPVFLWPIRIGTEVGQRGRFSLGFDRDREEVRVNPALQNLFSRNELAEWEEARDNILAGATSASVVMDELAHLAGNIRQSTLGKLPGPDVRVDAGSVDLVASAVLFHVTFVGQAIVEDIRQLRSIPSTGTNLESLLRVQETDTARPPSVPGDDIDRYTTAESDPTQDRAVMMARNGPGLVIEGPPGTGKSQTIVNMVADAIGRKQSLLIICQKQAALDVVCKRLQREGLGERLVMVTDLSKDRRPVIQAVRDQVEAILSNSAPDVSWQRQRKAVLDRIKRFEDRLNAHEEALHIRDAVCGRSYRELVSELVTLEDDGTIGDCFEIRDKLGVMDAESAGDIGETCASLSRLWLPAEYEGSALADLKAFGWDQATLARFHRDLEAFREAECKRLVVTMRTPGIFDFDDPEPVQRWVEDSRDRLCGLSDGERQELAYFVDIFAPAEPGAVTGREFIRKLSSLGQELVSIARQPARHDLDEIIARHNGGELERWIALASEATRPTSVLGRLSIPRYLKRRRLKSLLQAVRPKVDDLTMGLYLARARFEERLRAIRADIQGIYGALGFAPIDLSRAAANDLAVHAEWLGATLERVESLSKLLVLSPVASQTLAAAKSGKADDFNLHFEDIEGAIARSDARRDSRRALVALERWCEPAWLRKCEAQIAKNRTTDLVVGPIVSALDSLPAYQQYRLRASSLSVDTLAVLAALRQLAPQLRKIKPDMLPDVVLNALRREAYLGWKARLEGNNALLLLEHQEIEHQVRALAEAEGELRQVNKSAITANIDTRRIGTRDKWEDITRFTGPRARRLREFMDLGWDIGLKELRPVWLMGPDVASRMLPLRPIFDKIVYDEASQMPVEFALPTLFRGKAVIVSGDDKQLPPTSFFANQVDSDEEEAPERIDIENLDEEERRAATESWNRREIKDCPDLLELAKAVLNKVMLQVHYRSAYRELISFSNNAFYDGELNIPVRHPVAEIDRARPLEVIRVDGLYDQRTNVAEAGKVVDLLAAIWRDEVPPSVGVVTFNRDQADLIEQRLEERAEEDAAFRAAYRRQLGRTEHGEDMRFFVKNVENVQGDERDHIVFSTTFGRNRAGKFWRNFGVLGQSGGERRLNVAVTRARRKVTLVTSMPVEQIAETLSMGAKPQQPREFLQLYLAYATALSDGDHDSSNAFLAQVLNDSAGPAAETKSEADGFARSVASYVASLGLTPEPAKDGSAFSIDYAIRHPSRGTYGIGIECGSYRHSILARARAREIWRRKEMQKSMPVIHRVSLRGWYHDRLAEQSRLRNAIGQALE